MNHQAMSQYYVQIEIAQCPFTIIHIEEFSIQCFPSIVYHAMDLDSSCILPKKLILFLLFYLTLLHFKYNGLTLQKWYAECFYQELNRALFLFGFLFFNGGMPFTQL